MKKIAFITGANGFIGQQLVEHLFSSGWEVHALVRPGSIPSFLIREGVFVHFGDLRDAESLSKAMPRRAHVFNLAANPYHKTLSYDVNVLGTDKLLKVAKRKDCLMFTHISTQATKINTRGVYGTTKAKSDELVRASGIPFAIVKPSLVYGSGEKGLFAKISKLASKLPFIPVFGDGNVSLYPIHVQDLCKLLEKVATDKSANGLTFDVGGAKRIDYNTLYLEIASYLPNHPKLFHIPTPIGLLMAKIMSILPNPPIFEDNVLGSTQETKCDPFPLLKRYSFTPISFNHGVKEVFAPKRIRIGIVGLGKMGMIHASILRTIPEVEITALIDTNPKLFATFKSMGIPGLFFTSLDEALKEKKVDAVYITTPTFAHFPLIEKSVAKGIHVFVEKPVALNLAELRKLQKLSKKLVIHAGYTLLYHRPFVELFRILKDRQYGKVHSYEATFEHGEVLAPKKGWMFTKSLSGGGVLMNPGPHLFSILFECFGTPKKIQGTLRKKFSLEVEDEAGFMFSHQGFDGSVSFSWSIPGKHVAEYKIQCQCDRALITATTQALEIRVKGSKSKVVSFSKLPKPDAETFNINPKAFGEAYFLESRRFIDSISDISKEKVINTLDKALRIEEIIQDCYLKGREE